MIEFKIQEPSSHPYDEEKYSVVVYVEIMPGESWVFTLPKDCSKNEAKIIVNHLNKRFNEFLEEEKKK